MKADHALPFAAALLLGACASPSDTALREPYVKPGLIILTADQAARRGIELRGPDASPIASAAPVPPLDAAAVIVPSTVKAFPLNRYVDPADRELMHEEHVAYRRESSPQWRLDTAAGQKLLLGPCPTDGRQDLRPLLDKELTAYLAEQRRATEANQAALKTLFEAVQALDRRQQQLATHQIPPRGDADRAIPTDGVLTPTER